MKRSTLNNPIVLDESDEKGCFNFMNKFNPVILPSGRIIIFAQIKMTLPDIYIKKELFFHRLSHIPQKIGIEIPERDQCDVLQSH